LSEECIAAFIIHHPLNHTHTKVENLPQVPSRINHNHAKKPHTTATGCGESQYLLFCKSATKSCTWVGYEGSVDLSLIKRLKRPITEFNLLSGSCSYNSCTTFILATSVVGFMTVCIDISEIPVSHKRYLKNLQGVCLNLVLISSNFSSVTNQ
jgi:hypothetical protein